jgi:hypothetical protein
MTNTRIVLALLAGLAIALVLAYLWGGQEPLHLIEQQIDVPN